MRLIEQNRHFSDHRARLDDAGDHGIALDDFELSLDQDKQMSCRASFVEDQRSSGHSLLNGSRAIIQNCAHPAGTSEPSSQTRHGECVIVERIMRAVCSNYLLKEVRGRVARPTEVGYVSCTPPAECRSGAHQRAISRSSDSWVKETAQ